MSKFIPTHKLLQHLQSTDSEERDRVYEIIVIRFYGDFERYAEKELPKDDVELITDKTFEEIYIKRSCYYEQGSPCVWECIDWGERGGECTQQIRCVERTARAYLWDIHKKNILDQQRSIYRYKRKQVERLDGLDEIVSASESREPETSLVAECTLEDIWCAFHSLSESDQGLVNYQRSRGRPDKAREQAIDEAWARFGEAIRRLALSGSDRRLSNYEPDPGQSDEERKRVRREAWVDFQEAIERLEEE